MALADSGEIWEWFEVTMQGQRFSSLNLNLSIGGSDSREGRATRVVAGMFFESCLQEMFLTSIRRMV